MLADGAEFTRHAPAGPHEFDAVAASAFGTDAFRRFLAHEKGLNAVNLFFGFADALFGFHGHASLAELVVNRSSRLGVEPVDGNQGVVSFNGEAGSSGSANVKSTPDCHLGWT